MPGRRARSPGLGLDKFEAQALGFPKLWSELLGLGLGLACQGLRAQAYTSLLTDTDSDRMWHEREWHDHECLSRVCLFITSVFVYHERVCLSPNLQVLSLYHHHRHIQHASKSNHRLR